MWWNFLLLPYKNTHTLNIILFLCWKKGNGKFIPNSYIPNSYLYSQKSHFHKLNGWKTCPMGLTVTATKCNWTAGCGCMLFKIKNHQRPSATGLVVTSFRYSLKIHTFLAYWNAWDMAKMICYDKIQLCAMSCSCIFWHVENFYHHKNYMVNYYTLCSIFYNWFYIKNTSFY